MTVNGDSKKILDELTERAKELNCLYKIEEVLNNLSSELDHVFKGIVEVIPAGWQYVHLCRARILYGEEIYTGEGFRPTEWIQSAEIILAGRSAGRVEVCYLEPVVSNESSPFLPEEQKLLNTIAERISHFISQKHLRETIEEWEVARKELASSQRQEWEIVVEMLERTDKKLFQRISRKMLNYLCRIGVEHARSVLQCVGMRKSCELFQHFIETNRPSQKIDISSIHDFGVLVFSIAGQSLQNKEILENLKKWVKEDRVGFLVKALENLDTSFGEILDAVSHYHHMGKEEIAFTPYTANNINVLLIHRVLTEQLEFINAAKDYVDLETFYEVLTHTIYPKNSHGKLGGKSSGMLIANQIIRRCSGGDEELTSLKIPKTWYITSDALESFLMYNDLEEILEQKYKPVEQIREEYPNIVQVFKNSNFPPDIMNWLSLALDDFGEMPIIIRSSSLLEDRTGTAFSGKYKSLFLANQGSKHDRLTALMDAVAEVYASVFGPDPIEYRKEKGLVHFHEEMAIMIQEVIGTKVGPYFFPAFSGVAFSQNEFRWSPRIRRDDGLLRLVPGLGTRAVDRLSNDYPRLIAPGQPALAVNVTADERAYYSPKEMDVINLETNSFETVPIRELILRYGQDYPMIEQLVSAFDGERLFSKSRLNLDFKKDELVVTFDGMVNRTGFVGRMKKVLDLLKDRLKTPVDIEFAFSGKDLYLLQCRPQSFSRRELPAVIPKDLDPERILFTAHRYISNGVVSRLTHLVYVDPESYAKLQSLEDLQAVGQAVGRLNSVLPKRQFILMAPGRWGSRGDIKLGVKVSYSDISNTALLIEIARPQGNYIPDLSFGTHFFQDLVESEIRYLPLYPEDRGTLFNWKFFQEAENMLPQLLPEFQNLTKVLKVIDVPHQTGGSMARLHMNADLNEAVAFLASPEQESGEGLPAVMGSEDQTGSAWRWRQGMAERIAEELDFERFGVEALYLIGSTKNATASSASDIDLLVHFSGTRSQKNELLLWLEGWSHCLSEINYLRTGYRTKGLLDVHLISGRDLALRTSFASKVGASTDPARLLRARIPPESPVHEP